MNSSFSSISFDAETAIKFKKLAKDQDKTHTQLLNELIDVNDWKKQKYGDYEG